jgi:acetyl-CoA carboxylase biotin carboxyl carrier protein
VSINAKKAGPFDAATVESLIALMTQNDLSEIYLRDGSQHLRLRRGGAAPTVAAPVTAPAAHAGTPMPASTPPASEPAPNSVASPKKNFLEIKSETVGIFYQQPKPGDPPYVKLGDRVTLTKPVGMIVVMKTNHEIQAGCTGVIAEILVENEQAIEFGQVLFRVDPS